MPLTVKTVGTKLGIVDERMSPRLGGLVSGCRASQSREAAPLKVPSEKPVIFRERGEGRVGAAGVVCLLEKWEGGGQRVTL